jgi:hypothetical protein
MPVKLSVRAAVVTVHCCLPLVLSAQRKIQISAEAAPPTHEVKLTRRTVLTDKESPAKGGLGWIIAVDSRKRYHVNTGEHRFLVFDSTGKFLQSVGRSGRGPGEFYNTVMIVAGAGDTLYVSDFVSLSVFSPTYQFIRRTPARRVVQPIWLRKGGFAQITNYNTAEDLNWLHRLHILDRNGQLVKEIDVGPPRDPERTGRMRAIAEGPDGTIWSALWAKYVLDQWDIAGKQRAILSRKLDGDSFKGFSEIPFNEPSVWDLRFDQAGRLWVIVGIRNGKKHRAVVRTEQGMREMDIDEYDAIVDVIDLGASRLVASTRLSGCPWMTFIGRALAQRYLELDDGGVGIEILDFHLVPVR